MITFSQLKGGMSVKSKKDNVKKLLIDKAKKTEIYLNVLENFSDAELIDVNLKSEENNDD